MDTQRALIRDYGSYATRFDAIAKYLERWQLPAMDARAAKDGGPHP